MPTNRIAVEFENGAAKCTVWDNAGTEFDFSSVFSQVRETTDKNNRTSSSLTLRAGTLETSMAFQSTKKELTFDVEASVIAQILQML